MFPSIAINGVLEERLVLGGVVVSGIEIVGRACRLPGANDVAGFWKLLTEQQCSVTQVPEERFAQSWYFNRRRGEPGKAYTFAAGVIEDIWGFDPGVFSITPREARQMDPQQRLVLQLVWEALEDAGIPASTLARRNIGVYMGASSMDHSHRQYFDPAGTDSYLMTGNTLSLIANRVSYQFDLIGPSLTIDTACSSSLVALDYAVQDLKAGRIDAAIVGGVNGLLSPFNFMGFCAASMLSPDGLCRAFDHRANGYVRSEGGVVMVLQRSGGEFARHRIHGEVLASAMNSDGRTSGVALPSMDQQAELLRTLYGAADIEPARLAFVEAHGTGTFVGDPVECHALGKILGTARRAPLPIGSAKSNVGHLEPASGLVGLLKAQLALEHGVLPPTLHVEALNPHIPFDDLNLKVAVEPVSLARLPASRRLAGVNNFGFGGTNVHVIIGRGREPRAKERPAGRKGSRREGQRGAEGETLLLLSAHCRYGLTAIAQRYVDALEEGGTLPATTQPAEIAGAVAHGRDLLPERVVIAAGRRDELTDALRGFVDGLPRPDVLSGTAVSRSAPAAFVFSGNGAQWAGMGRKALELSPAFRRHFREVDRAYETVADISLEELFHAEDLVHQIGRTEIAQPLLFAIQVALARCFIDRGLRPAALIGHSVGEVAAAHISGALDLQQAASVVRARSHHQEMARGLGRMAALQASQADTEALIADARLEHVVVAAINSPRSVTVAGDGDDVRRLVKAARDRQIVGKLLDIQYPFHSARLDPARQPIIDALAGLKSHDTRLPLYSTVTGGMIDGAALNAEYWWRNVRNPVRFLDAIAAAAADGCRVFVEIGPRSILRNYIADSLAGADHDTRVVATLEPADDNSEVSPVAAAVGRAVVAGARFDVDELFGPRATRSLPLPQYPWQNKPFRMTPSPEAMGTFSSSHIQHPLVGARLRSDDIEWERQLDTTILPYLADHRIGDRAIMPGACYIEMVLAAAIYQLKSDRVELRDIDFVQALELLADASQEMRTRLEPESATVLVSSRARLSSDERQVHMRARFARLPSEIRPDIRAPERQTSVTAPPCDDMYRLAARFHLNYGPAFRRMTACREIGEDIIEVELSAGEDDGGEHFLHPVDFDACLHGLNVIYQRLNFGENKLSFVPVRIGSLRLFAPRTRVDLARIRVGRYSTRGAVADFELFAHDGTLVGLAREVRFKAATLVHRLKLGQAAYHVGSVIRALPAESRQGSAPALEALIRDTETSVTGLSENERTSLKENGLLAELAAHRILYDAARPFADEHGALHVCVTESAYGDSAAHPGNGTSHPGAPREAALNLLEEAGLARHDGASWTLDASCSLPPLEEIVSSILEDDPSWSAESIMLLNAARRAAAVAGITDRPDTTLVTIGSHAPATIEQFQASSPRSRAQIGAVAGIVRSAVRLASPLRPFRILQIGGAGGGLTREIIPLLADGRVHLVIAESDAKQLGRLVSQWQGVPGLNFVALGEDVTELQAHAHFDLVVALNGLSWMPTGRSVLSRLQPVLADGALAVISEREPDFFHKVVLGTALGQGTEGESAVALEHGAAWRQHLHAAGFDIIHEGIERLVAPGTSLLLGQRTRDVRDLAAGGGSVANGIGHGADTARKRSVLVIGRMSQSKAAFEHKLARALGDLGLEPKLTVPLVPVGGNARRAEPRKGKRASPKQARELETYDWQSVVREVDGAGSDGIEIVFAPDVPAAGADDHKRALMAPLHALSGLIQSLGDRTARIWVMAEGGARAIADLGPACPVQTGVWAFVRTAINEFDKLDLRLVDFAEGMRPVDKAARLAQLMSSPGDVRELVLTAESMFALEVRRGTPAQTTPAPARISTDDHAVVLQQRERGNPEELTWVRAQRRPPGEHEVEIEVATSGLNFRDVMWSLGLLPEEALESGFAGPTIGLECAGRIVRVGASVAGLSVGDPVIAIAPASFASHVTVAARAVGRLPSSVGLREAASIPVPFLTACYGLEYLAHVRKDEWVLIHGAAGGVGLAAIQVAKRNGAKIIATAGSDEKRNFLRRMGADVVLDTRSLDFVDQVREITPGGVNIVLNSLAGEAMERSLELLRPFGRFIELGKRDFYASTKVSLRPFRNNVSYFGVDADQLLTYEPEVAQHVLASVLAGFESGAFSPLPCRIFKSEEVVDAFRLMQKSGHIGKIIVEAPGLAHAKSAQGSEFSASGNGFHVVFGGTGGFGLEYARWLADRGARHIVIASRSGGTTAEVDCLAESLRTRGISLAGKRCDVTDKRSVARLLSGLRRERPIVGITHTAMVLDDGLIKSLTPDRVEKVLAPKVAGARNLDLLTRDDALDYFVLFSSAAAMFGNPGQASYVAANGYLDGLARQRRALGYKALSVAWGAITDVGVLARDKGTAKSLSRHTGGIAFTARDALDLLAHVLVDETQADTTNVTLAAMNWGMAKDLLTIMATPAYDLVRREAEARGDSGAAGVDLRSMAMALDEASAKKAVADYLVKEVASIFRMPPEDINPKRSLTDIGMDSLMGLELRMAVERQIGIDIMRVSMSDGTTINDIADHIASRMRDALSEADEPASDQALMLSQHVTEAIDVEQLRDVEEQIAAREVDLQRAVL